MVKSIRRESKIKLKICTSILLFAVVLGIAVYYGVTVSQAATVTTGTVNTSSSNLNVRNGPGKTYSVIGSLGKGTPVTILGEEGDWYKIQYGSGEGYVSKQYIGNIQTVEIDESYIEKLVAKGFPLSYATALNELHRKYPNWVFEPVVTGLDWNTVIKEESVLGINMVPTSSNDAQKSTADGAYDWSTNKWTILDGSSWVAASSSMISYCMDPRNFLDETNIFQFETLQYADYQNVADVSNVLSGTFMSGALRDDASRTYAATFMEAGKSANVNPTHLAARCRQEQGINGTSPLISGTYPGYEGLYNYFNIGAYGTPTSVLYQRGLTTARTNGWTSVYASITGGASHLANKYINLGQNTLYFQKFNVVNSYSGLYRHQYMANVQAAISESKTMGKAYSDKNQAYVFKIPVYSNMPESPCSLPTGGNPNNWLKSLSVTGYNLTPTFNGSTVEYSLIVGEEISSVTIEAAPVVSTSGISGTGNMKLNYGSNTIAIKCTAQNQSVRTYTLNIVRQEPEKPEEPETPPIRKGDVDGDGKIALMDYVKVKRHILGYEILTGSSLEAADVDSNGQVELLDYVKIKRHILGYEKIQ